MSWKEKVNGGLIRATGYRLEKARGSAAAPARTARRRAAVRAGDRLLERPAFVLSTVRSGSTLLRVLLNSHSELFAPHELHLRHIETQITADYAKKSLKEIGLDEERLRFLLWDRMLHRELSESGKRLLVNKTPNDVFVVDEIERCWPDARFIFLLRHPLAVARSRHKARPQDSDERNLEMVLRYGNAVEKARVEKQGLTVRYEDLAGNPEPVLREVCSFLDVKWEPSMLDYGKYDHGRFKAGLGDWTDKIKSGQIQPPEPLPDPDEVPAELRDLCQTWGYGTAPTAQPPA